MLAIKEEYKRTPKPPTFVPVLHQSARPPLPTPFRRPDTQVNREVLYNSHFQFGSYDPNNSNAAPQAIRQQRPLNAYEVIQSPGPAWWWKTPKIFGQVNVVVPLLIFLKVALALLLVVPEHAGLFFRYHAVRAMLSTVN